MRHSRKRRSATFLGAFKSYCFVSTNLPLNVAS